MDNKQELINLLNQAIEVEYGALFLLPQHLAQVDNPETVGELRAALQDEVDHAEITARLIFQLGGLPRADFKQMCPDCSLPEMLQRHLEGEERVIGLYQQALSCTDNPAMRTVLERLVADEQRHRKTFLRLLSKLSS